MQTIRSLPWSNLALIVAMAVAMFAIPGCSRPVEDEWSRKWPKRLPAGGLVEYQGQPLDGATVVFVAKAADGKEYDATGVTDVKGRFRLRTFRDGDGAILGVHRVQVQKLMRVTTKAVPGLAAEDQPTVEKNVLPLKYANYEKSGLTAEVTEKGPNDFTFMLDDSGQPFNTGRKP